MIAAVGIAALAGALGATGVEPPPRPRYSAAGTFAFMQVAGGAKQRDEALALGVSGTWRPLKFAALTFRYARAGVDHHYGQVRFDSAYHRFLLGPEGRLPVGPRFDFAAHLAPELTWLRSSLWSPSGDAPDRGRAYLGLAAGLGVAYRIGRIELRTDATLSFRDERTDRNVGVSAGWTWR